MHTDPVTVGFALVIILIAIALLILAFLTLRGVCRFTAKKLIQWFGGKLTEEEKTKNEFWVSIAVFITILVLTWKLIILFVLLCLAAFPAAISLFF